MEDVHQKHEALQSNAPVLISELKAPADSFVCAQLLLWGTPTALPWRELQGPASMEGAHGGAGRRGAPGRGLSAWGLRPGEGLSSPASGTAKRN